MSTDSQSARKWTVEEEAKVVKFVFDECLKFGAPQFEQLSRTMDRSPNQIKMKWHHTLKPGLLSSFGIKEEKSGSPTKKRKHEKKDKSKERSSQIASNSVKSELSDL